MRLGKVKGTVTATLKSERLSGLKLLLVDVVDWRGEVMSASHVAPDACGAGVGDLVLLAQGSAARMASGLSSSPTDMAVVAVVDQVSA